MMIDDDDDDADGSLNFVSDIKKDESLRVLSGRGSRLLSCTESVPDIRKLYIGFCRYVTF